MSELGGDPSSQIELTDVELMHETNAAAWRRFIKEVANAEVKEILANPDSRSIEVSLNNGKGFNIEQIPWSINVTSLAVALRYLFIKLESFPMAMEVKEL